MAVRLVIRAPASSQSGLADALVSPDEYVRLVLRDPSATERDLRTAEAVMKVCGAPNGLHRGSLH